MGPEVGEHLLNAAGTGVEFAGVFIILAGFALSTGRFLLRRAPEPYTEFRHDLGRSVLLGLEFLVAGDIIRTVAVAPTLENLYTLGLIVLIRTFLSMTIQVELEGRWPWRRQG